MKDNYVHLLDNFQRKAGIRLMEAISMIKGVLICCIVRGN